MAQQQPETTYCLTTINSQRQSLPITYTDSIKSIQAMGFEEHQAALQPQKVCRTQTSLKVM